VAADVSLANEACFVGLGAFRLSAFASLSAQEQQAGGAGDVDHPSRQVSQAKLQPDIAQRLVCEAPSLCQGCDAGPEQAPALHSAAPTLALLPLLLSMTATEGPALLP
jgi:hypothetical protein